METQKEQTVTVSLQVPLSEKVKLMRTTAKHYRTMSNISTNEDTYSSWNEGAL